MTEAAIESVASGNAGRREEEKDEKEKDSLKKRKKKKKKNTEKEKKKKKKAKQKTGPKKTEKKKNNHQRNTRDKAKKNKTETRTAKHQPSQKEPVRYKQKFAEEGLSRLREAASERLRKNLRDRQPRGNRMAVNGEKNTQNPKKEGEQRSKKRNIEEPF